MELRSGRRLRSSEQLGEDRMSALPDDLLLLVLARLGCFRAAVRTGVLARRWHGLWARLRHIVFRDVPFPALKGALLRRVPDPPPAVSLLEIHDPEPSRSMTRQRWHVHAAIVRSLLTAAARLEPEELVFVLASGFIGKNSPMLFLHLPAGVHFPALHTLSLTGCHVRFDSLLPWCPRLRVLRLKLTDHGFHDDYKTFMSKQRVILLEHCRFISLG